ncbi:thiamine kinase [Salmonella enterica subsp. enterica serovar Heidelberg str. N1514]|nr:thiamine kinase [Salmonella enterica subsp. enterica serovar Heidelberg str. N1514]
MSCCAVITTPTLHQPIFYVITAPYPNCQPVLRRERFFYTPGWMAVEYLHGVVNSALPDADELAALLYHLHQQPRFGWRIALSPLLAQYWSCCDPARRTPFWLRRLKQLQKNGEPRPLRLAPLHMDVHGDNIVLTSAGLRLIDWEYAGDGDIALELAAVWVEDERQHRQLADAYAARARIDARQLWRQIRLWHPWVIMLKAGWFEYRWRQTGEQQFIRLADETWRQLRMKG